MEFICNVYNPDKRDAKNILVNSKIPSHLKNYAFEKIIEYINEYRRGDPQGTEKYTSEELKKMGYIGLYQPDFDINKLFDSDHGKFVNEIPYEVSETKNADGLEDNN